MGKGRDDPIKFQIAAKATSDVIDMTRRIMQSNNLAQRLG
jgi:hypothetical protein